jgi:polygalacturonase
VFRDSHFVGEAFRIGSETSGDVVNVSVRNCDFGGYSAGFAGIAITAKRGSGGKVHLVSFEDSRIHATNLHVASWNTVLRTTVASGTNWANLIAVENETTTPYVYGFTF